MANFLGLSTSTIYEYFKNGGSSQMQWLGYGSFFDDQL